MEEIYLDVCMEDLIRKMTNKKNWYLSNNGKHYSTLVVSKLETPTDKGRDIQARWQDKQDGVFTLGQTKATRSEFWKQFEEFKNDKHKRHDIL